ncbi:MAG: thioesterase domain-containing protein [Microcystis sp. LE18-22.4A]|uniref:thioesterase domain-containing protein n=1 Tax=Microcystis sp. LE18-22.4A TaxID=3016432 RepID=UPI0022CB4986|nr:thioesterase domain-containing protein [Microcystis sp. LE18-22.4A]MCZ8117803.1 thioesterase domain-containing protein [Microcystis sp. LE18-22.4A]
MTQIWKKILGLKEVGIYDNFFDLGGDSILAVKLVAEIEKICSKELSIVVLYQAPTVEKLAKILSRGEWSSSWYSLVPIQPLGDKIPLFAIHLLGEGLSFYRPLANYLGLRQPIYGLNYGLAARKGKEKEDKLPPIENLAAHYIEEMQAFYPQGPYILLGVSNGGNVAFEMAKQLQAQGQTVAKLILFDTLHPHLKLPPHWKKGSRFQKLMSELIRYSQIYWGNFLLFEPQERVSYLLEKLKSLSVQKIIQRTSFPVQPSEKTLETKPLEASPPRLYLPQSYPGKITLFRAKHTGINAFDPTNGWEGVADEGLEIYDIHGAHSHIFSEPSVRILSEKLRDCLTTDLLT